MARPSKGTRRDRRLKKNKSVAKYATTNSKRTRRK